jgi:RNA recognition motif-containing protein
LVIATGTRSSKREQQEKVEMGTKLYVGNLSYESTESGLRSAFAADGRQVQEVAVVMDRETGRPRGFAFVQMGSEADAKAAIAALDGKMVDGRALKVNEAKERTTGGRSGGGGTDPSAGTSPPIA